MNKETGMEVWVTPKLEKIEMLDTRQFAPKCGSQGQGQKNNEGSEAGKCGQGS